MTVASRHMQLSPILETLHLYLESTHPALLLLASTPDSRLMRGPFIWAGLDRMHGNSADKTLIVREAFAEDHHALVRDFILANILGMISAPHLDHQDRKSTRLNSSHLGISYA